MHTHVLQRTKGGEGSSSAEFTVLAIKPSLSTPTLTWRHASQAHHYASMHQGGEGVRTVPGALDWH